MKKIYSIQFLRALAACIVVLYHTNPSISGYGDHSFFESLLGEAGQYGVDLFFVISGFVISYTIRSSSRNNDAGRFFVRRLIRVAPLYWVCTLAYILIYWIFPAAFNSYQANIEHILSSLFFLPHANDDGKIYPVIHVGWTLNFEFAFYTLAAVIFLFGKHIYDKTLAASFFLLMALAFLFPATTETDSFEFSSLYLEFFLGGLVYFIAIEKKLWCLAPLLTTYIYVTILEMDKRVFFAGIPSSIILFIFLYLKNWDVKFKPFTLLGDASYSIYLVQCFTIPFFGKVLTLANLTNGDLISFIAFTGTVISGVITYIIIEKPVTSRVKKLVLG